MQIIKSFPPNIQQIKAKLNLSGFNPIFTYGDKIYNPLGLPIPEDLIKHEEVHQRQQEIGVENWWEMYLDNPQFRLSQEVEAYREQWKFINQNYNRENRRHLLKSIINNLSSSLYGNLVSKDEARELINV